MWRPLFDSGPWLILCCLVAFLVLFHGIFVPGLSVAGTAQIVILISVARLALALVRWVPTWHVLTNCRIINIQGVRVPRVLSCSLLKITGLSLTATMLEKATHLGTISFDTNPQDTPPASWASISCSEEVHAKIQRAIHDLRMR